jgi:hypothetical protein
LKRVGILRTAFSSCFTLYLGCQIFRGNIYLNWENIPKYYKIFQIVIKYTKWPENIPNGHKIYQHLPLQDPSKFTPIGIFGLKNIPSGNPALYHNRFVDFVQGDQIGLIFAYWVFVLFG